ncbi:MAG: heat-inducible transcriptional repressor HrcA [Alphaproteobacteria bacterium]
MITELNERSREIFRLIVDAYVETGEPVGSRTLARKLGSHLSPATIRNVMADLQDAGLLYAPHTSAGRLPTELGLRLFVDGLLEIGALAGDERARIDAKCAAEGRTMQEVVAQAIETLSGLSRCAGLVVAPKLERPLKHIEFVYLGPGRALVVMVAETGIVENRVIELPLGMTPSAVAEAGRYLAARMVGRTVAEARAVIRREIDEQRAQLNEAAQRVVEAGLATWSGEVSGPSLILRGQAHLLDDVTALDDLERVRGLFDALETKDTLVRLLDLTENAQGVKIFIGSESPLFGLTGCAMIVAPFGNGGEQIVGAIGVIGPMRMNYSRIIPMVDYTSKVISRLIG